jgi:hypothetical protein
MNSTCYLKEAGSRLFPMMLPLVLWSIGCGGGSAGPAESPQDFSISTDPTAVIVGMGGSETLTISMTPLNGFAQQVNISFQNLPTGVTASPATLEISPGPHQVQLTAAGAAPTGSFTFTVIGVAGNLNHSVALSIMVETLVTTAHAPILARYLRTNSFYDPNSLQYSPPHFTAYDSARRQFFVSNPYMNEIDVFDANQETETARIPVPFAWGIDISPNGGSLWAGTLIGDIYEVNPTTFAVTKRFPSASIGPSGYTATEAFVLSDGRLALLGPPAGGILGVDGAASVAVWDPVANILDSGTNGSVCPVQNIGPFALTGDRRLVLAMSVNGGPVCAYDPVAKQANLGAGSSSASSQIVATPDGTRFFVTTDATGVDVFDAKSLQIIGQIVGTSRGLPNAAGAVISLDGKTLFLVDGFSGAVEAFDTTSLQSVGWIPSFTEFDLQHTIVLSAIDETGLMVGPIGHGVAFLDGAQIQAKSPTLVVTGFNEQETGPTSGGTIISNFLFGQPTDSPSVSNIFVGNAPGTQPSFSTIFEGEIAAQVTTPPSIQGGAKDLTMVLSDGGIGIAAEGFSYGPTILEVAPNAVTADGGQVGAIIGYGFGNTLSSVRVTVGGQPAAVTALFAGPAIEPYPFPAEGLQFTIPTGTAGSSVDVTVTTPSGTATSAGFRYTASVESFPLTASLQQGVYDSHRGLYYFTDRAQIQVLSRVNGKWLTPIPLPNSNGKNQLTAISESPDGTLLAVSDFGGQQICGLNPDDPSSIRCFAMPLEGMPTSPLAPAGLAVANGGTIYFATFQLISLPGISLPGFHKLNTGANTISDLGTRESGSKFDKVILSPDGSRVYAEIDADILWMNTATDQLTLIPGNGAFPSGALDFAVSGDGSTVVFEGTFMDAELHAETVEAYIDWETWFPTGFPGQRLSADGSILFQPLTDGLDLIARNTGHLLYRVQIPAVATSAYESYVVGEQNFVGIISTAGVSFVDLSTLPIPAQLSQPFPSAIAASAPAALNNADNLRALPTRDGRSSLPQPPQLKRVKPTKPSDLSYQ